MVKEKWLLLASGVLGWVIRPKRQRARRAGLCRDGARCARTGRSRGSPVASLARCPDAGRAKRLCRPQFHALLTCGRPKQIASSRFCSHTVQAPAKPKESIQNRGVLMELG